MVDVTSLAPGLLVAAPPMGDPNFDQSVVLLANHDRSGAFGWVINGKNVMTFAELFVHAKVGPPETARADGFEGVVRLGGPIGQEHVWLLFRTSEVKEKFAGQIDLGCGISASSSQQMLRAIRNSRQLTSVFGVLGYAGWAPQQLESEVRRGGWLPTDAEPSLVFDRTPSEIWQSAYARVGVSPISFTSRHVGLA